MRAHISTPAQILEVEVATTTFALALTDVLVRTDPLMNRATTYDVVRREAAMAATDIGQMMLGVPDIDTWGEGVQR